MILFENRGETALAVQACPPIAEFAPIGREFRNWLYYYGGESPDGAEMEYGRFTLPGESGIEKEIKELARLWGADAIRDSDGTELSQELIDMGLKVYSTICLVRMDNGFAKSNREYLQRIFLTSDRHTADGGVLSIDVMENTFAEQFEPDTDAGMSKYWQVMDRTAGEPLKFDEWEYKDGVVTVKNPKKFHSYSVNFLARQIWEPVSMYNHLTNNWDEEHKMPIDPVYPEVREHILEILEKWLCEHPKTDIVRFTTFFYCFDLIYDRCGKEKTVNWFGYLACVSPAAIEAFERKYGYALTPEDFIDNFRYNTPFKNPTKKYLDWMEFVSEFVSEFAKECVDLVHKYNKKAIMFLGDHWAGTEPYGKYFQNIGLDAVVGAAGDGVTTRMIADIPVKETEARFYPYLFPDVFHEGGDPVGESSAVWLKCRRAVMRKPMERMGYGGYISLALKFPDFIEHVTGIASQFKSVWSEVGGAEPQTATFKVAVLNSWGVLRSWQTHQVAHSLWNQRCYSYLGALEALSGLSFEVVFLSFDDIRENGIGEDIGVILNAGDAGTAWSGGGNWNDGEIITAIREWVYNGGGFIGIGEPCASSGGSEFFALSDILGVQKEIGFTAGNNKPKVKVEQAHFITRDVKGDIDFGEGMNMLYKAEKTAEILDFTNLSCCLAANVYGKGRAVYIAGLPYNAQNSRILNRAVYWAANAETEYEYLTSDNINIECGYYPGQKKLRVMNNSTEPQNAAVKFDGKEFKFSLKPLALEWVTV
jgi:1,3-beta-galactosyl-N-acetylhexosamine phosphorylase